jgi:hypothetical protein
MLVLFSIPADCGMFQRMTRHNFATLMKSLIPLVLAGGAWPGAGDLQAQDRVTWSDHQARATMSVQQPGDLRTYQLTNNAPLRDNRPPDHQVVFSETAAHATVRSGNVMFDGLYALAVHEAMLNSVASIKDGAYGKGAPLQLEAYQTGEFWTYVWTRDLAYSVNLALGGFDPPRAVSSLLFKTSVLKDSVTGGNRNQIIQDTGSGGSYPVSSDRVVWALGADKTLQFLPAAERETFLQQVYPILHDTIEQDRRLVFDRADGLYRGEQSFLDWREQTYPGWTKNNVLPIAMSKALSVNAADYFLLSTAAEYARRLGHRAEQFRYHQWAAALKQAINQQFFDADAGLYSTYLLSDGIHEIRTHRYDLLGESLAILTGVTDLSRAQTILQNYPVGPYGPAVVWPQERTVPIYHNQAIWPFVIAFWTKAARQAGNVAAVDAGVQSLTHQAAFNLSNMENFDFASGQAQVTGQALNGPVINSRRQLWSVAGYLSMVQDVVFGLETSWDGICFRPFVTARMRNETFAGSDVLELRQFNYCGAEISVRVHLPPASSCKTGVCSVNHIELNGQNLGAGFVTRATLQASNQWDVYLAAPNEQQLAASLKMIDVNDERARFGPAQPVWDESQNGGITVTDGKLVLHYQHSAAANAVFNIYRDGVLCAQAIPETNWTDVASGDLHQLVHHYAVEAVDPVSGNASHLSPPRFYLDDNQQLVIPAADLINSGGNLVANHHFENWGQPGDTLQTKSFKVSRSGRYAIRAEFSNGAGPVNTGITCALKKLEVRQAGTDAVLTSGYLVMPQSGDWQRWDKSSSVLADLVAGKEYVLRLSEDDACRNMSSLKNNERYTAWPGGGPAAYDYVNIATLQLTGPEAAAGR